MSRGNLCKSVCKCENGTPLKWPLCKKPDNRCSSCFRGFHIEPTTLHCVPNHCQCAVRPTPGYRGELKSFVVTQGVRIRAPPTTLPVGARPQCFHGEAEKDGKKPDHFATKAPKKAKDASSNHQSWWDWAVGEVKKGAKWVEKKTKKAISSLHGDSSLAEENLNLVAPDLMYGDGVVHPAASFVELASYLEDASAVKDAAREETEKPYKDRVGTGAPGAGGTPGPGGTEAPNGSNATIYAENKQAEVNIHKVVPIDISPF